MLILSNPVRWLTSQMPMLNPMMSAGTPSMVATRLPCGVRSSIPGVEQHDDENEQHHDRAGINDDLHGGNKLRS